MKVINTFLIILFILPHLLFSQNQDLLSKDISNNEIDDIDFPAPTGYTDEEFKELQKAYIQPYEIDIRNIKTIPLDEMSNEFIEKLISFLNDKADSDIKKEVLSYLEQILIKRKTQNFSEIKNDIKKNRNKNRSKEFINENQFKQNKNQKKEIKNNNKPKPIIRKKQSNQKELEKTKNNNKAQNLNIKKSANDNTLGVVTDLSFASNQPFININSASSNNVSVKLSYPARVKYADVSFYIKNIPSNMIYLLRRFTMNSLPVKSRIFSFKWSNPQIAYGKYKIFVKVKFFDSRQRLINEVEQFWGNSLNNDYIIFKN